MLEPDEELSKAITGDELFVGIKQDIREMFRKRRAINMEKFSAGAKAHIRKLYSQKQEFHPNAPNRTISSESNGVS